MPAGCIRAVTMATRRCCSPPRSTWRAEAAALLKESLQLQPTVSINQALLAACYGNLGETDAARAAIASYRALSSRELHDRVTLFRLPEHRKAYLDGIDLAM